MGIIDKVNQNLSCPPEKEYVKAYTRSDGVYVNAHCKKKRDPVPTKRNSYKVKAWLGIPHLGGIEFEMDREPYQSGDACHDHERDF